LLQQQYTPPRRPTDKDELRKVLMAEAQEDYLDRQYDSIAMSSALYSLSIVRFLAEQLPKLPLAVCTRLLDTPPPEAGNMLDLLCTVAGRESKPSSAEPSSAASPASPDVDGFSRLEHTQRLSLAEEAGGRHAHAPRTHGRTIGSDPSPPDLHLSANDRLAKALAGVGAAGSLARIRQQSATMGQGPVSQPPAVPAKRQRYGY